ncbi:MAG: glycoside hydrolase family 95 protein [Cytophagales bacterium]|nr:glycoside hydrolase family 95 protein [Cytophagales bacterium]
MKNFFRFSFIITIATVVAFTHCNKAKKENKSVKYKKNADSNATMTQLVLWYEHPALQKDTAPYGNGTSTNIHGDADNKGWCEALPIGNGRLAAMIFGGIKRERIQLNEESLWSGKYAEYNIQDAKNTLDEARKLIFDGKNADAQALIEQKLTPSATDANNYQSLGDLYIDYTDISDESIVTDYYRDLHIDSAIATEHYHIGDKFYTREMFASLADNVIVIKLTCNQPSSINATISMRREADAETVRSPFDSTLLIQRGALTANGLLHETQIKAVYSGGTVRNGSRRIVAQNVDELVLIVSAATNYRSSQHAVYAKRLLLDAAAKSYQDLRRAHIDAYKSYFTKVQIDLNPEDKTFDLATDKRLEKMKSGVMDKHLMQVLFQYGRYLLISSSQPGTLPANLQGKWNEHLSPLYGSGYKTVNSLPIIYTHADATNLSELKAPLLWLADTLTKNAKNNALSLTGTPQGIAIFDQMNIFGNVSPATHQVESFNVLGAVYICNTLFETYNFNQDIEYLKKVYPFMKLAAQFVANYLVQAPPGSPIAGKWVVCPSLSDGNEFMTSDGATSKVSYASTQDQSAVNQLFSNIIIAIDGQSDKNFRFDPEFRKTIINLQADLAKTNSDNAQASINEWPVKYQYAQDASTSMSAIYPLFPYNYISKNITPEMSTLAQNTLQDMIPKLKPNSYNNVWAANCFARLLNNPKTIEYLLKHLQYNTAPNLMSVAPPFSIEGNMLLTNALTEMLLQSQDNEISILPCLPKEIASGSVKGLKARGGFVCDIAWNGNKINANISSLAGNKCQLRVTGSLSIQNASGPIAYKKILRDLIEFETNAGESYTVSYIASDKPNSGGKGYNASSGSEIWPNLGIWDDLGLKF